MSYLASAATRNIVLQQYRAKRIIGLSPCGSRRWDSDDEMRLRVILKIAANPTEGQSRECLRNLAVMHDLDILRELAAGE